MRYINYGYYKPYDGQITIHEAIEEAWLFIVRMSRLTPTLVKYPPKLTIDREEDTGNFNSGVYFRVMVEHEEERGQ